MNENNTNNPGEPNEQPEQPQQPDQAESNQPSSDLIKKEAAADPLAPLPQDEDAQQNNDLLNSDELDPANQSLADALRISFTLLKIVMAILAIIFIFSNTKNIDEGKVGVKLMFGAVVGDPGDQVKTPGGPYWLWPEPIGRFIEVETTERAINIDTSFWYFLRADQVGLTSESLEASANSTGLRPGIDGSLLTGDQNIVHAQFTINYAVRPEGAVQFVTNITAEPTTSRMSEVADALVQSIAESEIVNTIAGINADQFLRSNLTTTQREQLRRNVQETLDLLNSGITVTSITIGDREPPLAVAKSFREVNNATTEKATKISQAGQVASTRLFSAAGEAHTIIMEAVNEYEDALATGDQKLIDQAKLKVDQTIENNSQGEVASILSDANQYRSTINQRMQAEARIFEQLLPAYQNNPNIEIARLWQGTLASVLRTDIETFFQGVHTDNMILEVSRDPRLSQMRQRLQFEQQTTELQQRTDYREVDVIERERERREADEAARQRESRIRSEVGF